MEKEIRFIVTSGETQCQGRFEVGDDEITKIILTEITDEEWFEVYIGAKIGWRIRKSAVKIIRYDVGDNLL